MGELVFSEGDGRDIAPSRVLVAAAGERFSGSIVFHEGDARSVVVFADGEIVAASSNRSDSPFKAAPVLCLLETLGGHPEHVRRIEGEPDRVGPPIALWEVLQRHTLLKHGKPCLREAARAERESLFERRAAPFPFEPEGDVHHLWANTASPITWAELQLRCGRSLRVYVNLMILVELGLMHIERNVGFDFETAPKPQPFAGNEIGVLSSETALNEGKRFLERGWLGAARYRFEDIVAASPDHLAARAFLTWLEFRMTHAPATRGEALGAINAALAASPDVDLLVLRAMLYRTQERVVEAMNDLRRATAMDPGNRRAMEQLECLAARRNPVDNAWEDVPLELIKVNADIIIQRRIGIRTRVHNFFKREIRLGSSEQDDVTVSESVLPDVARNHCAVLRRGDRFFLRRNASRGRVWIGARELPIRQEVPVEAGECVRLGDSPSACTAFEFRLVTMQSVHDMGLTSLGIDA